MADPVVVGGDVILTGGQLLGNVHAAESCVGPSCPVHHVSDHPMRTWPQNYRGDRGIMERLCAHGIGHPDPDDRAFLEPGSRVHGCDGCCSGQGPL